MVSLEVERADHELDMKEKAQLFRKGLCHLLASMHIFARFTAPSCRLLLSGELHKLQLYILKLLRIHTIILTHWMLLDLRGSHMGNEWFLQRGFLLCVILIMHLSGDGPIQDSCINAVFCPERKAVHPDT